VATARDMQSDVVSLFAESPGQMELAINHHHDILEAIAKGDSGRSAQAMAAHIRYTSDMVQTELPQVNGHRDRP
jgi:DNA-binding GntR family transcriptional regulator